MKKIPAGNRNLKKGLIWYGVRASLFLSIAIWIIFIILQYSGNGESTGAVITLLSLLWFAAIIFNFVTSIIHLVRYKQKAFAITSLVISSILLLLFTIGFIIGVIAGINSVVG